MKYGVTAEEAFKFGLPCGGTIELVLEPLGTGAQIDALLARVAAGRHTVRTLDLRSGVGHARPKATAPTCSTATTRGSSPRSARAGGCW